MRSLGFMRHSQGAGVGGRVGEQQGLKCVCLCLCFCVFLCVCVYVCVYVCVFLCGGGKQRVFWGGGGLIQFDCYIAKVKKDLLLYASSDVDFLESQLATKFIM